MIHVFRIQGRVASKKNHRRTIQRGKQKFSVPSEAFEAFEQSAVLQLKTQWDKKQISPPYSILCQFYMVGMGATDLDNMSTSICDVLQKCGIIWDDMDILELTCKKFVREKAYETIIQIETLKENCLLYEPWKENRDRLDGKKEKKP